MRRGATLLELIVVGGVFLGVLSALWMIYDSTMRVERKVSLKVDVDREVFAAARHLDALLKTCRLVQPSDWANPTLVESLELKPLQRDAAGQPTVSALGFPEWGPSFLISFENGDLLRGGADQRKLARLGTGGSVQFLRTSQGSVEMRLKVQKVGFRDEVSTREITFPFRLYNQ